MLGNNPDDENRDISLRINEIMNKPYFEDFDISHIIRVYENDILHDYRPSALLHITQSRFKNNTISLVAAAFYKREFKRVARWVEDDYKNFISENPLE